MSIAPIAMPMATDSRRMKMLLCNNLRADGVVFGMICVIELSNLSGRR